MLLSTSRLTARPSSNHAMGRCCRPLRPRRCDAADTTSGAAGAPVSTEPIVQVSIQTADGAAPVTVDCPSGEQLRFCLLENKVDLYTTWGKIWSCGGVGQCGTCIVKVTEGAELLSERTATEDKKLKGKPNDWRLACQTIVGDGTNSGKVVLATKPQTK